MIQFCMWHFQHTAHALASRQGHHHAGCTQCTPVLLLLPCCCRDCCPAPSPSSPLTLSLLCCVQVTSSRLSSTCGSCGAAVGGTISGASARTRLVVFRHLAAFYGFTLLQQVAGLALTDGHQEQQ